MKQRHGGFRSVCAGLGLSAVVLLGGCYEGGREHRAIQDSITPELMGTSQRRVDMSNMTSLSWNTNNRMFWDDLSRAFYTDRPSHLTPYAVPR